MFEHDTTISTSPSYLSYQFTFTESMHTKCTRSRSSKTIFVPLWNNNQGERTLFFIIEEPKYGTSFHPMYVLIMIQ